ncbi:hypothetical protein [Aeromonas sp. DSM 116730]|uniref:hypothetical protein n=1 Tax=Aeromonas sp. DSM 116730 TaxID=3115851 RepID=UPI0039825D86
MPLSHMTGAKRRKSCSEKEDVWRKRLEKEKTPQGRLFDSFALSARKAVSAYSHSIVNKNKNTKKINALHVTRH